MKRFLALTALLLCGGILRAAEPDQPGPANGPRRGVFDLSLEQLMDTPVTSVSRKETPLSKSAAAVAVITQDDIRRFGVTSLPEALRLAPGLEVARINAHSWAIAARGFNGQFSDKLLVLLDGRILYESVFPGVYWDIQDLVLEDVDRIEVIRGPGATLWGANAVNGVINIITRRTAETTGAVIATSIGSDDRPTTSVRYGGSLGPNATYRAYGKLANRDGLVQPDGAEATDAWHSRRGGARVDWAHGVRDSVTLQTDAFTVRGDEYITRPVLAPPFARTSTVGFESRGGNALGRWRRQLGPGSDLAVQAFYAGSSYASSEGRFTDDLTDVELTHRFTPAPRHDVVWGGGYRYRANDAAPGAGLLSNPRHRRHLETAFVQDEIALAPERFAITLGTKIEHNTDTGLSADPSVRALWTPRRTHTVWGAISRAMRTPDLVELGGHQPVAAFPSGDQGPVILACLTGNAGIASEAMTAYELGYRTTPVASLSFDVAAFYNRYRNLIGFIPGQPTFTFDPVASYLALPLNATNLADAHTMGYELSAHWNPTTTWRLSPTYTYLRTPDAGDYLEFDSPTHRASLLSSVSLPRAVEINGAIYAVGALERAKVPAYTRLDVGATWKATPSLELGLWGQNLSDDRHVEFFGVKTSQLEALRRSVVASVTWRQ